EAQTVLKQRGIAVVSEKRPYLTDDSSRREWKMLVPKKIKKPDAQSTPAVEERKNPLISP
ncbi:hypothetical protein, partial [Endozoicomonas sp. ONNA1]